MPSKNEEKTVKNGKISSIDPIYKKYTKSIIRSLASTEFYEFFMDMISHAENSFQFSNRKVVKSVDVSPEYNRKPPKYHQGRRNNRQYRKCEKDEQRRCQTSFPARFPY